MTDTDRQELTEAELAARLLDLCDAAERDNYGRLAVDIDNPGGTS